SISFDVPGDYELELTVSDPEFSSTDTVIFTVTDAPIVRDILLVVGATPAVGADAVIASNLQNSGYLVTSIDDNVVATTDGVGRDLIVISSTVSSGKVGNKFQLAAVPVLTWEAYLFDDLGMTGVTTDIDYGVLPNQQGVDVVSSGHPLTAGLSGNVQFGSTSGTLSWGVPSGEATIAATVNGDSSRATIFGYDQGDSMPGLIAPARRVGFALDNDTASNWTAEAQQLFTAAVNWVFSPAFNTAPMVEAGDAQTVFVNTPVSLMGQVTDDGVSLPLVSNWSLWLSDTGGNASFTDASNPLTTVSFDTVGNYTLQLEVSDPEFTSSDQVTITVTDVVQSKSILFVSGSAAGNTSDQILITRLEQQGHQVQVIDDNVITSGAESGFDLVLVSSTVSSGKVGNKLTGISVPIVNWEAFLFDNLGMSGDQSGDFGSSLDQTQIEVTNASHPLAAGQSGLTAVTNSPQRMYWGQPGVNAINIAHVAGDPSRSTVFAYEAGVLLANNLIAQSRHVGLFMGKDAPVYLTVEALQLFDVAVSWALGTDGI
ncbi:MAG: hypothetical protein V3U75_02510, partial [Methylococcaceae bacterium]